MLRLTFEYPSDRYILVILKTCKGQYLKIIEIKRLKITL